MSYKLGQFIWAILMLIGRKSSKLALRSGHVGGRSYTCLVTEDANPALETLVFLHGFTGCKDDWLALIKQLHAHVNVLVIDLPGHGGSHFDPAQDFVAQSVRIIEDVLWFHKCERIHILGAGTGALVACAYAEIHPQKVQTIVLIGPAGIPVEHASEFYAELDQGQNPFWVHTREAWRELSQRSLRLSTPDVWPISSYLFGDYMHRQSTYRLIWDQLVDEQARIRELDLVSIDALPCRKLLVWGKADRILHADTVSVLETRLSSLAVLSHESGGHMIHCEQPRWLAKLLLAELTSSA